MTTFVLVHGAWHGSWAWQRVRRQLHEAGHEVFTPTLTGVGERSHLLSRDIGLETHILDVVNLIVFEELDDIVLCGHSYGGCVVTGVADRLPEKIRALVYLDAFVPANGENVLQHVPDQQRVMLLEGTRQTGEGWRVPPIPAAVFNLNAEDADWVDRQCTPQPIATFEDAIRLTGGIDEVENVSYVRATGFVEGSPFPPFEALAKARGWPTVEIAVGHDVMLDAPDELTRVLLEAAA